MAKIAFRQVNHAQAVRFLLLRFGTGSFALFFTKTITMKNPIKWLFDTPTDGPKEIIFLRLMAGGVFLWEGMLKFVYPNQGVGRFTKLGFPFPEITAHSIATLEMVGGLLLLVGLFTRITSFYFILQMAVAVLTTKIALYYGTSPLPMPPAPPKMGFWAVLHEIRSDYAQILTCTFLMLVGPGMRSLDAYIRKR
jgi:putative oxidoreductase